MTALRRYILITAARNEEAHIEKALRSVLSQTVLPLKWLIVSDNSTDRTEQIVAPYLADNPWLEFVKMVRKGQRSFVGKALCFNAGYERMKTLDYDYIGNLDADISFGRDLFEFLLTKLDELPGLGLAGTPYIEDTGPVYDYPLANLNHVSGCCQLFRRACFEAIGGYMPVEVGGIDWVACLAARMTGWQTRSFPERHVFHHRNVGTAEHNAITAAFRRGMLDYCLGYHPLWEPLRAIHQLSKHPLVARGVALYAGFVYASIRHLPRPISDQMLRFNRAEQMERVRNLAHTYRGRWSRKSQNASATDVSRLAQEKDGNRRG